MSFDLTNKNISDTFQNLLQKTGSGGHIYDLQGKHIETLINEYQIPGYHSATWNGNSVPSGLYICRLSFGSQTITQKMLFMK